MQTECTSLLNFAFRLTFLVGSYTLQIIRADSNTTLIPQHYYKYNFLST